MENEETKRAREAFEQAQQIRSRTINPPARAGETWGDLTKGQRSDWIELCNAVTERHERSMNVEHVAEALLLEQAAPKSPETRAFAVFISGMLAGLDVDIAKAVAWPPAEGGEAGGLSRPALSVAQMRRTMEPRGDGGLEAVTRVESYEPMRYEDVENSNLTLISKTLLEDFVAAQDFRDNTLSPIEPNDETRKATPNYLDMGNEGVRFDDYVVLRLSNIDLSMRFLVFNFEGTRRSPNLVVMSHVQVMQSMASPKRRSAFSPAAKHEANMEINQWIHGKILSEVDKLKAGEGIDIKTGDPIL